MSTTSYLAVVVKWNHKSVLVLLLTSHMYLHDQLSSLSIQFKCIERHGNGFTMTDMYVSVGQIRNMLNFKYKPRNMCMQAICNQRTVDRCPIYIPADSIMCKTLHIPPINFHWTIFRDYFTYFSINLPHIHIWVNLSMSYHVICSTPNIFVFFHSSHDWSDK